MSELTARNENPTSTLIPDAITDVCARRWLHLPPLDDGRF